MQLRAQEEFLGSMKNQLILFSTDLRFGGCCYLLVKLCPTLLCDPMDCSPPCSSVHRISQARVLGWVAISFSRGYSWPRDQNHISCIGRWILYTEPPGKPQFIMLWTNSEPLAGWKTLELFPAENNYELGSMRDQILYNLWIRVLYSVSVTDVSYSTVVR